MTIYRIAELRQAYLPDLQGIRRPNIDDTLYDTAAEARAVITSVLDNDMYVTANGESGRPDYLVIDDRVADWIEGGRNGDVGNYDWDGCDCTRNNGVPCGECNDCIAWMIAQDRHYIRAHALNRRGETIEEELARN